MNTSQSIEEVKTKFQGALNHFSEEAKKIRTGRAAPSMLDGVMVNAYGSQMPLIQVATVNAVEAQLIQITPFDPNNIQAIASAIRDNPSLGLNPVDDGRVVRIQIPALTEERRTQIVKTLHEKVEDSMISLRQIRHDALKAGETAKKDKSISEDDYSRFEKQVDELMAKTRSDIESLAKTKEQEIMTV